MTPDHGRDPLHHSRLANARNADLCTPARAGVARAGVARESGMRESEMRERARRRATSIHRVAIGAAIACLAILPGCYVHTVIPLDQNLDRTELGAKEGRASTQGVLWLFAWGDGGTQAAARDGEITVVNHADREVYVVLGGLYSRLTTIVYGD